MRIYLLDTNSCIHWTKNEYGIAKKLEKVGYENCFISELTIAELLYGVANSAPTKQVANRRSLNQLQAALAGQILPIADCFELYATEKARRRKVGRVVDDFDLLIGATAVIYDLTLVTRNTKHFVDTPRLVVEDWVAEYNEEQQAK